MTIVCYSTPKPTKASPTALPLMRLILNKALLPLCLALAVAAPASSATLLPNLFAKRYCDLRALGATKDQAIDTAVRDSLITEDRWFWITKANGTKMRSDSLEAARAIAARCPEYI